MTIRPLILASSSVYRRQLLERLRAPFGTAVPDIDESALPGEAPRETALRLRQLEPARWVPGAGCAIGWRRH